MGRGIVLLTLVLSLVTGMATAVWAGKNDTPLSPDRQAWKQVNSLDVQSLQSFVKQFPQGEQTGHAKEALALLERFSAIRQGRQTETVLVSAEELGQTWKDWHKMCPDTGVIGYFVRKGDRSDTLGWFTPGPFSGGKTPARQSYSFDKRGVLTSPTGDGSIIAFRTGGLRFELYGGLAFETPGSDPVYFGVWKDRGLVHLGGAGRVTLPNGKSVELK
ncbi:MAG TPA: hypothetical protein PLR71_00215 [Deltaproteobacteria bacterium]|nr:hypothetical protein [Deltaproteobacteria bacterium]HQI79953.1 hypothetical protein [Deltaproteobacteria bacterium]